MSYDYKATMHIEGIAEERLANDVQFTDGWVVLIYGPGDMEAFRAADVTYVRVVPTEISKLEMA